MLAKQKAVVVVRIPCHGTIHLFAGPALHNVFSDAAAQIILLSGRIGFPIEVDNIYAKGHP